MFKFKITDGGGNWIPLAVFVGVIAILLVGVLVMAK